MDWNSTILVFAAVVVAVVVFDLFTRSLRHKRQGPTFPCFYCQQHTTRRDGYCSDEHRDEDLRTAGFEAEAYEQVNLLD